MGSISAFTWCFGGGLEGCGAHFSSPPGFLSNFFLDFKLNVFHRERSTTRKLGPGILQVPTSPVDPGLFSLLGVLFKEYCFRFLPKDEDEDFQKLFHGVLALSGASNFYPAKVLP